MSFQRLKRPSARAEALARVSRASEAQLEVVKPFDVQNSSLWGTTVVPFAFVLYPRSAATSRKASKFAMRKGLPLKPLGPRTSRSSSRTSRSLLSRAPDPHCSAALGWPPWSLGRSPGCQPSRSPPPDSESLADLVHKALYHDIYAYLCYSPGSCRYLQEIQCGEIEAKERMDSTHCLMLGPLPL